MPTTSRSAAGKPLSSDLGRKCPSDLTAATTQRINSITSSSLQRIPTEAGLIILAKSLNPTYDPFHITAKMDFEVFGKVLTVWKSEQL